MSHHKSACGTTDTLPATLPKSSSHMPRKSLFAQQEEKVPFVSRRCPRLYVVLRLLFFVFFCFFRFFFFSAITWTVISTAHAHTAIPSGICKPYKSCYIIFLYHFMHFLYGLPPLATATATYCFVLDITITDYYVIHIVISSSLKIKLLACLLAYLLTYLHTYTLTH